VVHKVTDCEHGARRLGSRSPPTRFKRREPRRRSLRGRD
jgi:hypothetical protein